MLLQLVFLLFYYYVITFWCSRKRLRGSLLEHILPCQQSEESAVSLTFCAFCRYELYAATLAAVGIIRLINSSFS